MGPQAAWAVALKWSWEGGQVLLLQPFSKTPPLVKVWGQLLGFLVQLFCAAISEGVERGSSGAPEAALVVPGAACLGLLMQSHERPVITLEGSWKNKAKLSVNNTLFQTVFISGDPLVPGVEQDMFFIWFMS